MEVGKHTSESTRVRGPTTAPGTAEMGRSLLIPPFNSPGSERGGTGPSFHLDLSAFFDLPRGVAPLTGAADLTISRSWLVTVATGAYMAVTGAVNALTDVARDLDGIRTRLDTYYRQGEESARMIGQVLNLFDPFRFFKYQLGQTCRGQNVSNAWLRLWELLGEFPLVPSTLPGESFLSLHNAALPGHWILALNHYVKTATSLKSHVWFALAPAKADDTFKLREHYPSRWLGGDGDVTRIANLRAVRDGLTERVHLYTSDQGLDVTEYEAQEEKHAMANVGQILLGLYVLGLGGNMVIKLYTFFSPLTQSLIALCVALFERVHVSKPMTSKVANSECYLVALNLRRAPADLSALEQHLEQGRGLEALTGVDWGAAVEAPGRAICGSQIALLTTAMDTFEKLQHGTLTPPVMPSGHSRESQASTSRANTMSVEEASLRHLRNEVRAQHNQITGMWAGRYPIKTLKLKDRLNCLEVVNRAPNPGR